MFERYSVSSCHHREKNNSNPRHNRAIGPAPSWAPCSNAERNIAKFSEMRMISKGFSVEGALADHQLDRAVRDCGDGASSQRDAVVPHGTSDSIAITWSSRSNASTS